MFANHFRGKTVWLSGHTGFKGAWLAQWLVQLGARVHGFAQPPATTPSVFEQLGLAQKIAHEIADVRDAATVKKSILRVQPDFVFHLAAQALVRYSYEHPLETYATNVMGTAHVLEALRSLEKPCAAVIVTTDKCYENREMDYAYAEEDPSRRTRSLQLQQRRGGNRHQRVSPFFFRQIARAHRQRPRRQRHRRRRLGARPHRARLHPRAATRRGDSRAQPRRHAPVAACAGTVERLPLAWRDSRTARTREQPKRKTSPPHSISARTRKPTARSANSSAKILKHWPGRWEDKSNPNAVHEARLLMLSTAKAKTPVALAADVEF